MTKKKKVDLYDVDRFSPEQLLRVQQQVQYLAETADMVVTKPSEALEKNGWLRPYLFAYDTLLWGRWAYWSEILIKGTIEGSGPIPQISWSSSHERIAETKKMLNECVSHYDANIGTFADWLLWGLGASETPPAISEKVNEHYYKTFDLFPILDNPTDYLSHVLSEQTGKGYKDAHGYYPTPFHITTLMNNMVYGETEPEEAKKQTVNDPCVGCGAMLLPASNYSLKAAATDVNRTAIKLCKIQMFFYAPWFAAHPEGLGGFEKETQTEKELVFA